MAKKENKVDSRVNKLVGDMGTLDKAIAALRGTREDHAALQGMIKRVIDYLVETK